MDNTIFRRVSGFPDFTPNGKSAGYVAFYVPAGEVVSVSGIDEVENYPYIHASTLGGIKNGMVHDDPTDKRMRYSMILSADSRSELEERIKKIRDTIHVIVRTESGEEKDIIWS